MAPERLQEMKFCDIEKKIQSYLQPKTRITLIERTLFNQINQENSESAADYLVRLRKAARYCKFEELKLCNDPEEEMIKVAFISGLSNEVSKAKLLIQLSNEDLSLAQMQQVLK